MHVYAREDGRSSLTLSSSTIARVGSRRVLPATDQEGFFQKAVRGLDSIFAWAAVRWWAADRCRPACLQILLPCARHDHNSVSRGMTDVSTSSHLHPS